MGGVEKKVQLRRKKRKEAKSKRDQKKIIKRETKRKVGRVR